MRSSRDYFTCSRERGTGVELSLICGTHVNMLSGLICLDNVKDTISFVNPITVAMPHLESRLEVVC
jgi:hypothetical protein